MKSGPRDNEIVLDSVRLDNVLLQSKLELQKWRSASRLASKYFCRTQNFSKTFAKCGSNCHECFICVMQWLCGVQTSLTRHIWSLTPWNCPSSPVLSASRSLAVRNRSILSSYPVSRRTDSRRSKPHYYLASLITADFLLFVKDWTVKDWLFRFISAERS